MYVYFVLLVYSSTRDSCYAYTSMARKPISDRPLAFRLTIQPRFSRILNIVLLELFLTLRRKLFQKFQEMKIL